MAIMIFLWRILKPAVESLMGNQTSYGEYRISYGEYQILMAKITSRYGENYSGMAKTLWRTVSSGGSFHFSGTAAFLARRLAHSASGLAASRRRSSSAKRANREAERASDAVPSSEFNGSMTASMNLNSCPASFCLILPSIDVATDFRPADIVAAQEHQKQFRSQIGGNNVLGTTGAPRFPDAQLWRPGAPLFSKHRTAELFENDRNIK